MWLKFKGFGHQINDYLKIVPVTLMCESLKARYTSSVDEIEKHSCIFLWHTFSVALCLWVCKVKMAIPMQQPFLEIESAYDFASPVGSLYIDKPGHFSPFPKVVKKRGYSWRCETRLYRKISAERICNQLCQTLWWRRPFYLVTRLNPMFHMLANVGWFEYIS